MMADEFDEPEINPVEILSLSFWTDDLGTVEVPGELLKGCLEN